MWLVQCDVFFPELRLRIRNGFSVERPTEGTARRERDRLRSRAIYRAPIRPGGKGYVDGPVRVERI